MVSIIGLFILMTKRTQQQKPRYRAINVCMCLSALLYNMFSEGSLDLIGMSRVFSHKAFFFSMNANKVVLGSENTNNLIFYGTLVCKNL